MVFGTDNNETFYAIVNDKRFDMSMHAIDFKVSPVQYAGLRQIMFSVKPLSADDVDDADTFKRFAEFVKGNALVMDSTIYRRPEFADEVVSVFCSAGYFFETIPIASVLRASFVDKGLPTASN